MSLQGLLLPMDYSFKAMGFADDVVVGISSQMDCETLNSGLLLHQEASNAKLNVLKSQCLPLNDSVMDRIEGLGQVLSRDEVFTYLGYPFHPKCYPLPVTYFNSFLDVLQTTITTWQKRNLTLPGRVLVLNSRLLSKLWYLGYLVTFPTTFFKKLWGMMKLYLWNGKRPQISLDIFFTTKSNGGLGLINPVLQLTAIKGWWIQQHLLNSTSTWAQLSLYIYYNRYLPQTCGLSFFSTAAKPSQIRYKGLWLEMFVAWKKLHGILPDDNPTTTPEDWTTFAMAELASTTLLSYTIKSGHTFLQGLQYPMYQHSKWDIYIPTPSLPWPPLWQHYFKYMKYLPHPQSSLWWRLLHHNIITAKRLSHYVPGITGECRHCGLDEESINHVFYSCNIVAGFWDYVKEVLVEFFSCPVADLEFQHILRCNSSVVGFKAQQVVLIGFALWSIWRVHNAAIFDNGTFSTLVLVNTFRHVLSVHLSSLFFIAKCNQTLVAFKAKWLKPPFSLGLFGSVLII
jgi:hypothetical protein